jgi:hypothetical protein
MPTERQPMDPDALRLHIRSTLQLLGGKMWSIPAEELLLGTCAQESHLGTYRRQLGGGPGTGIYQIETSTEQSLWTDYIDYRGDLAVAITRVCGVRKPDAYQLEMNLSYQHIMCRLRYWAWVKEPIPPVLNAQAKYWDDHYNCNPNAGTVQEYVSNYRRVVSV